MAKANEGRWQDLVAAIRQNDGLITRPSGVWTADKLYHWHQYIGITTKAMIGNPRWPDGLVYVDLFAGTGICEDRDTREWFPGSPLIAANAPRDFARILLVEKDRECAAALRVRMEKSPAASRFRLYEGDCNERVGELVAEIPAEALTIAVIDPPGLNLHFDTVEALTASRRVDLLILFADAMDAIRNLEQYSQPGSRLDRVMGPGSDWRERMEEASPSDPSAKRDALRGAYEHQLRLRLGYKFIEREPIRGRGPLYNLVFACNDKRGVEFWRKSFVRERRGQRRLPGM